MVQSREKLYSPEAVRAVEKRGGDPVKYLQTEIARRDAWSKYKRMRAAYMRGVISENAADMARFGREVRLAYKAYEKKVAAVEAMTGLPGVVLAP